MSALANLTKDLQPKEAPLLPIPDISKPQMEFAGGGIVDIPITGKQEEKAAQPASQSETTKGIDAFLKGLPPANPKTGMWFPPTIIFQSLIAQGATPEVAMMVLQKLGAAAEAKKIRFVQIGNTVFVITPKPDKSAEFLINTVEPRQLSARIFELSKTLKQLGFRKMTTMIPIDQGKWADILIAETKLKFKKVRTTYKAQKDINKNARQLQGFRYEAQL